MSTPIGKTADEVKETGSNLGLSPRQLALSYLWSYYACATYDARKTDWNGLPALDKLESEAMSAAGSIPPGFYDANSDVPLKFRRPSAPYYLGRVIVQRFTGLLFSQARHPAVGCKTDPLTDAWLQAFVAETRLWSRMVTGRAYGGAMGSLAVGFKVLNGKPSVEVHDPRWCTPVFKDRQAHVIESMEKRYQFLDQLRDPETGNWVEAPFWYRRVIDERTDTTWNQVPVGEGKEPRWDDFPSTVVEHGFGECPVVWVQNVEVENSVDGDPDCHGVFDLIERIDALYSQADRGTVANCDPTPVITSNEWKEPSVRKGSSNAITLEIGGSAQYLELTGAGGKAALELAAVFEEKALRVARCVLDINISGPARSEEETAQNYSSMLEQADVIREQYGEKGIKVLLEMVLRCARKLAEPKQVEVAQGEYRVVTDVIMLPPRVVTEDDGAQYLEEVEIGTGERVELEWPSFVKPPLADIQLAAQAAGTALAGGLLDRETAIGFIAPYFGVVNVKELVMKAAAEAEQNMQAMADQVTARAREPAPPGGNNPFQAISGGKQ